MDVTDLEGCAVGDGFSANSRDEKGDLLKQTIQDEEKRREAKKSLIDNWNKEKPRTDREKAFTNSVKEKIRHYYVDGMEKPIVIAREAGIDVGYIPDEAFIKEVMDRCRLFLWKED